MFESFVHHFRSNTLFEQNKMQLQQLLRNKEITQAEYNERLMQNLLQANKITQDDFAKIMQIDNSKEYRRLPWISRQYLKTKTPGNAFDFDELRNTVTEFIALVKSGYITDKESNIEMYPSFEALQKKVSEVNEKATAAGPSKKEAADMEVDFNSKDALVVSPLSHEAARKLGLSEFAHRVNTQTGQKDCAWCVTYKNPTHWNDFTDNQLITFYFAKPKTQVKLQELKKAFPKNNVQSMAILVSLVGDPDKEQGKITSGYDANDKQMSAADVKKYLNILGVPIDNEKAEKNV